MDAQAGIAQCCLPTQGSWMNLVLAASLIALIPVALAFAALHRAWQAPATSSP
jgi:hypothetical protein